MVKAETWDQMEARHMEERRAKMLEILVGAAEVRGNGFLSQGLSGIANYAAARYGVTVADLRGSKRTARIVSARQFAYVEAQDAGFGLSEIGRFFGDRDHTTVISGIDRHKKRVASDADSTARVAQTLRNKALRERERA